MKYPVIIIPHRKKDPPFLATSLDTLQDPVLLTSRGESMRKALFFSLDGVYKIQDVSSPRKPSLWNLLIHRNDSAFWEMKIRFDRLGDYTISDLVGKLEESMEEVPDDVWMQFHEKEVIIHLLRECKSLAEVIAVGCLIGIWEPDAENKAHLPELHDNSDEYDPETSSEADYVLSEQYAGKLSRASILQSSREIRFDDDGTDNAQAT